MMICEFCGAEFKDGRGLANHIRTKHSGVYLRAGFRLTYTPKNATFKHGGLFKTRKA